MPTWKWDEICQPKQSGGLGIKSFSQYQLVFGVKLFWQLLTSSSLWAQWMKSNYFSRSNILQFQPSLFDSGTVKWLFEMHNKALPFITCSVDAEGTTQWAWNSSSVRNLQDIW